jgi:hypothetical protein
MPSQLALRLSFASRRGFLSDFFVKKASVLASAAAKNFTINISTPVCWSAGYHKPGTDPTTVTNVIVTSRNRPPKVINVVITKLEYTPVHVYIYVVISS